MRKFGYCCGFDESICIPDCDDSGEILKEMEMHETIKRLCPKESLFRLRKSFLIIVGLLLLLGGILAYYVPNRMESDRLETIAIGDEILKALEACFADHNQYPASLEALVPKYLDTVKEPPWGDSGWIYDAQIGKISVGYKHRHGSCYPVMYYRSGYGWVYDT